MQALVDRHRLGAEARRALTGGDVAAPELLDLEVLSALRGLHRGGLVTEQEATQARARLGRTRITRCSHTLLAERVWELRDNLTVYDACYVALAERIQASLATRDRALASAPGIRCEIELVG
ncbi:MAG: type II toxin-antitoxin system VapC family toxin [Actinomycetota bacterium]|nr:type II toxin-antitoxin system VapC family toxin [Actinomycetota bacterium]